MAEELPFGVMLYEMLTFRKLFPGTNALEMAIHRMALPRACDIAPHVPHTLSSIVARCVAYNPDERYPFFAELAADLTALNASLADVIPIPRDTRRLNDVPAEWTGLSAQIAAESYSLISFGRYEEAACRAQEGINLDSENPEHWVNRGKAFFELEDFDLSRDCFQRATALAPGAPRAAANLAWSLLELGHIDAALTEARQSSVYLRRRLREPPYYLGDSVCLGLSALSSLSRSRTICCG